jgi:integrase-like protein
VSQPKLIDQLRSAIRIRNYSPRTEEAYWHWIKKFILFHNKRHPSEMGEPEATALFITPCRRAEGDRLYSEPSPERRAFLYQEILNPAGLDG